MEKPSRTRTLDELKEIALHWSIELRKAEKAVKGAPDGKRAAAKDREYQMWMKWSEAVDNLLGKVP